MSATPLAPLKFVVKVVFDPDIASPRGPETWHALNDLKRDSSEFRFAALEYVKKIGISLPSLNNIRWVGGFPPCMEFWWTFDSSRHANATAHMHSSRAYLERLNKNTEKKRLLGITTISSYVSLHAASLPSTLSPPPPRPLPPKTGDAPPVVTSSISYKTQIPDRPSYSPLLPSDSSVLQVLLHAQPASIENFVPAFHPYLFALNNAIVQLKAIHDQLRVAEDYIATIAARDDALVARMQEAEAVVQQARATMGRNETENRILKKSLKDAESKVQHAEQRASAAEESLANIDLLLQSPVGQENKWCYQQLDALQPDMASEEAHLQAPQTVLSTSLSVNSKSVQASLPLLDDTARSEAEARIVDHMRRFSQSEATAQAHMRDLIARLSSTRHEAELALGRAKEQVQTAKEQASAAEARALDLQVELFRNSRVMNDYKTLLRNGEERSTRMDAQTRECQKALTAAVLRGDQEASERRAAQLTFESICAERGSPFVVPPLLDALRLIVRHSAHTKR